MTLRFIESEYTDCLQYIEDYWQVITVHHPVDHHTLIGLPYPYVVANHRMFQEMYYWDTYFISVGLETSERSDQVIQNTENCLYLLRRFARIPNTTRFYHLSRSQPPFLSQLILMSYGLMKKQKERHEVHEWLESSARIAQEEYWNVWRGNAFPDHREVYQGLSRYYDIDIWHMAAEAESGWDMTPRFYDRCLDFLPVDLNSLLYRYERDFSLICQLLNMSSEAAQWDERADERKRRMNRLMWNEEQGCFFDFDFVNEQASEFRSIACFFPLYAGLASEEQAARLVADWLPFFEQKHGIVTTEEWYAKDGEVGKQWAWPNGWAPLNYIVVKGLVNYGYHEDAKRIALKWLHTVNDVFAVEKKVFEKYNVVDGGRSVPDRYPDQPGFGWTNAIVLAFYGYLKNGSLHDPASVLEAEIAEGTS